MSWSAYGSFLLLAVVLVLIPGQDFAVVTRNTLMSGRWRGAWSAVGVTCSNVVQGALAAAGISTLLVRARPVFEAVTWLGVAYLGYLGVQAIRSAVRGEYPAVSPGRGRAGSAFGGWRQGFLSNITNPKVLVFYLAVLPQFLPAQSAAAVLFLFAISHALLGLVYLGVVAVLLHRARRVLQRRRVRRIMDGATGTALLGFGLTLAVEAS
ncbi:MAG: LysE family translocator [Geodermatophilaceae bacterium]